MTILRSVTEKIPASSSISKSTNIPFSFTLTPYGKNPKVSNGDDDDFKQKSSNSRKLHFGRNNKNRREKPSSSDQSTSSPLLLPKEYLLSRCTQCGAPINHSTQFVDSYNNSVICNLCRYSFHIDYETQFDARVRSHNNFNYWGTKEEYKNEYQTQTNKERGIPEEEIKEYSLPLFPIRTRNVLSGLQMRASSRSSPLLYSMPASKCPPILILLIDGTSNDSNYYKKISQSILKSLFETQSSATKTTADKDDVINDTSSGVEWKGTKIAIFIMTKNGGLSLLNLNGHHNDEPHLQNLYVPPPRLEKDKMATENQDTSTTDPTNSLPIVPLIEVAKSLSSSSSSPDRDDSIFVSLDSNGTRKRIETALCGLEDSTSMMREACQRFHHRGHNNSTATDAGGVFLGSSIRYILDYMEDAGFCHPGMDHAQFGDKSTTIEQHQSAFLPYVGGKMMCFLAGPPAEIGSTSSMSDGRRNGRMGMGGFGGSCSEDGNRFSNEEGEDNFDTTAMPEIDADDPEAGFTRQDINNDQGTPISGDMDFVLPDTQYNDVDEYFQSLGMDCADAAIGVEIFGLLDESEQTQEVYFGFPLLQLISERSGGCGPLLVSYSIGDRGYTAAFQSQDTDLLAKEILARSPWHWPTAFGALLRIRLSSGLCMDTKQRTTKWISSKGRSYSRVDTYYKNNGLYGPVSLCSNGDDDLFYMGTCDPFTTLSFDATVLPGMESMADGMYNGNRRFETLQPCVQSCFTYTSVVKSGGEWMVVRRLRVLTSDFQVARDTETLTASVDKEALSVALFHKFYESTLQIGLEDAQIEGRKWLLSTLLSLHQSAQEHFDKSSWQRPFSSNSTTFFPEERLVSQAGGNLSKRDVLLGKGHSRLKDLNLIIYSLLNCDALRPGGGWYNPSLDARCAAASNIRNTPPQILYHCLIPRVDLWLNEERETQPICEDVTKLSWTHIQNSLIDQVGRYSDDDVDESNTGPIMVVESARNIILYDCQDFCNLRSCITSDDLISGLQESIKTILSNYRNPPNVLKALGQDNISSSRALALLKDIMIQDVQSASFESWNMEVAEMVYGLIDDS